MNTEILGTIAAVLGVVYMAFGLPIQIRDNYKAKSTKGLSLIMISALSVNCLAWTIYAIAIQNIFVTIPNALGVIFTVIILIQFWIYKKTDEPKSI